MSRSAARSSIKALLERPRADPKMSSEGGPWATPGRLVDLRSIGTGKARSAPIAGPARPTVEGFGLGHDAFSRPGEAHERDYVFLTPRNRAEEGRFAESAQVHDHYYGTPAEPARSGDGRRILCVL
jgi:hypothetical protein